MHKKLYLKPVLAQNVELVVEKVVEKVQIKVTDQFSHENLRTPVNFNPVTISYNNQKLFC